MKKMKLSEWLVAVDDCGAFASLDKLKQLEAECPDTNHPAAQLLSQCIMLCEFGSYPEKNVSDPKHKTNTPQAICSNTIH